MTAAQQEPPSYEMVRATVLLQAPAEMLDLLKFVDDLPFAYMLLANMFRQFDWALIDWDVAEATDEDVERAVGVSDAARYGVGHLLRELEKRGRLTPEIKAIAEGMLRRTSPIE